MFPGGWLDTDNKTISVQLNLTGTGTELGNIMNAMNAERTDTKELSKPTYRGGTNKMQKQKGMNKTNEWRGGARSMN